MPENSDIEPVVSVKEKTESNSSTNPRRQPRYNVILWNDNDHSYEYVIKMMIALFHQDSATGLLTAKTVDTTGRAICLTTTLEHAELKRDQIHAFGPDKLNQQCQGSMSASIEPVPE